MMIGYDIWDRFTMEHFPLSQSMNLTPSFFARDRTFTFTMVKYIEHVPNDVFQITVACPSRLNTEHTGRARIQNTHHQRDKMQKTHCCAWQINQTNGSGEDEENVLVVAKSNDEEGHEEGDGDQGKENYSDTNKEKDGKSQVETIKQNYDGRVQKCGDSNKQNDDDQTESSQKKIFLMF
ncbi:hypothetical protein GEV33_003943 [Tenebrio molitor]|uniref:Uncharacterized protein n=1 Tax=Tenebrio molitor TaxID=7067 RepID=A0A8J6HRB8_TENMO|nr:hypothetical protein GEV33_003943 [Tenebrio molitor]